MPKSSACCATRSSTRARTCTRARCRRTGSRASGWPTRCALRSRATPACFRPGNARRSSACWRNCAPPSPGATIGRSNGQRRRSTAPPRNLRHGAWTPACAGRSRGRRSPAWAAEMPKLKVLPHAELCPQGALLDAPEGTSILDTLLANHIDIEHACEKSCACTTCHVVVREGLGSLDDAEEKEEDMLDKAWGLEAGC